METAPRPGNDESLSAAIAAAADIPQLGAACRAVAERLGFPLFQFGFRMAVSLLRPCQIILSGYPAVWRARYDECNYLAIDPVLRRALNTVVPFGWDELSLDTPQAAQLFTEAAGHGLCHGFSAPAHGAHGEGALFSFARRESLPDAGGRVELFRRAHWFTTQLHERMRTLVLASGQEQAGSDRLSPRERQCLQAAAEGQSAISIARQLQIAESTVIYHLNRAETKLGVRTRQHAVARAVLLGELTPACYPVQLCRSERLLDLPLH